MGVVQVMDPRGKYHLLTQKEWDDTFSHDVQADAVRYIEIEDECWAKIGGKNYTGRNESIPL